MFHHDLSRSGSSTSTALTTKQTLWKYRTGGPVESSQTVANGVVYVGSDDDIVYAFGPSTGIPEYPSYLIPPVLMVATVALTLVWKKKRNEQMRKMSCVREKRAVHQVLVLIGRKKEGVVM
jgi:hypothetical protein